MENLNAVKEIRELKSQFSYTKRIGFFLGAGTSCALGLPNIAQLTNQVEASLVGASLTTFQNVKTDLQSKISGAVSIEDILNQIRRIREITGEREDSNFIGINGAFAKNLDIEICRIIYNVLMEKEASAILTIPKKFLAWLSMQNRESTNEIFTTNYDLIIEKSLESIQVPYFDGFVGSYEPFFWQDCVEREIKKNDITQSWIRLWKIHGSLSWFWKANSNQKSHKVVRLGKIEKIEEEKNEIVIYPSKDKYDSSRRQPFLVYFDRLKNYLLGGELLFVFSGYSFLDQHINEIIFNCLRQNNRLNIIVFFYSDAEVERMQQLSSGYFNLSVFGPTTAIVNGVFGKLNFQNSELQPKESCNTYWNETEEKLMLGDFNALVDFLVANSGRKNDIEVKINEE
ncbi:MULTISPECIES: SIR2 family protein [unclassified Janthinobacterium]|uniref:SIR2 family protein n=1 Tax=unclassified Janthinobacterium TaxID=2610881 RepID=UPI0016182197|nr:MULTISPECIES: SIR2 family protein [unclassified Janthinobacterium]MBB5371324.1 hypothetical protein [Janthinobacterium sp. K2C7]MBB5384130.1 hypothetical protein [Janthinobacterium sp. K2Li3]MBB5389410.1 hypothetical protein [Janthinobacterium sp. K2E3]